MDSTLLCARTGCASPAAAVLTFSYSERAAWLDDLDGEVAPSSHALCGAHADRLTVPRGWTQSDRRQGFRRFVHPPVAV